MARSTAPAPVLEDLPTRLERAAAAARDSEKAYRLDVELRDELIEQAADEGMEHRAIARACGFKSPGAVTRILAKPRD